VDLSAVFLDVAKDRLYTLAPDDPARRSAQTVLWQALHDLTIGASPLLAFTAEEVWLSHPGLTVEAESVHLASWPERAVSAEAPLEWEALLALRSLVNAAIEPLRANKELATTAEAEVTITAPRGWIDRLASYRDELPGFLLVAGLRLKPGPEGAEPQVAVTRTALSKCERCWTYRADVAGKDAGSSAGLCGKCVAALQATGRSAD
jgi:isoleucyl-tRNA synthetase